MLSNAEHDANVQKKWDCQQAGYKVDDHYGCNGPYGAHTHPGIDGIHYCDVSEINEQIKQIVSKYVSKN